jgi:hypothetical protein
MNAHNAHEGLRSIVLILLVCFCLGAARTQQRQDADRTPGRQATEAANSSLIQPEELVNILKSPRGDKPLIIQTGVYEEYVQAHIPGSEYMGPSSKGVGQLRKRMENLPRMQFIVLYCGCCPWNKCPNVTPAYKELHKMGFKKVKLLYLANDFGTDWVNKAYPTARGK